MANHTGVEGLVKVNGTVVAEVKSFTLSIAQQLVSQRMLGDTWDSYGPGLLNASGRIACFWDETDTSGQTVLQSALLNGTPITLVLCPEGFVTTDIIFFLTAQIDNYDLDVGDNDSIIGASFTYKASGSVRTMSTTAYLSL